MVLFHVDSSNNSQSACIGLFDNLTALMLANVVASS